MVRACPVEDELVTDEGSVVLLRARGSHRVVRLSMLGQLIRELAVEAISVEVLARELESRIGSPPGGSAVELALRAVQALERDGLVAVSEHGQVERDETV
jgi:hypothetical protein